MDHARLQRQIGRATGLIFLISLLPTALFVAFGAHILAGVFGPAYATGHLPFAILCLAQLGNVACGFTGLLLEMTGRERDATAGVAGGVLTNLVLNLVLIPPYGMAGAAVATAVGLLVWNMLLVVSIRRRLNINATAFNPTIWRDIFRAPAKP
jgi:O-antigen/teichoic acid export membrane protein